MDILLSLALSQHLNFHYDYNQIHPHIRLQEDYFIAGTYYNSEERISPYVGIRYEVLSSGLELGVTGNYPALGTVLPYARYTYDFNNTRFFVSPAGENVNGEISIGAVIGIEFILNK